MKNYFLLVALLLTAPVTITYSQSAEQFRQAATDALKSYDTPGFSVGIIKDGEVILSEGFGTRIIGKEEEVNGSTLYAIASNTKAFVSTAITKLHVEGELNLNDPVQKHLPYFKMYDEYVSEHTTVKDLLCHRVGLGTFSGDAIWYKSEKSAEEIIKQIHHLPQAYEWRGGYGYTNLMFITAGEVIKSVTGKTWSQYIQDNFLSPLEMSRTRTSVGALEGLSNIATPHVTHRDNLPIDLAVWDAAGAAGGIFSSTDDILKWLEVQLNPSAAEAQGIFPERARNIAMTPHNALNRSSHGSAALGWFTSVRGGKTIVRHGGGYDGMYSNVMLIPELGVGIVVLSNSMTGLPGRLSNYIRDTYLGLETEGWLEDAKQAEAASRKRWQEKFTRPLENRVFGTSPSISNEAMTGSYNDPLYGSINIESTEEDGLVLLFEDAPALSATLTHWHFDTWQLDWHEEHAWFDFGTVQVLIDSNREVKGLEFNVPNDDIFFEEIKAEVLQE